MTRFFRCACIALWAAVLAASFAWAQTTSIDYDDWSSVALRAEEASEAGRASTDVFESLRSEIAGWREVFLTAQGENAQRIDTIQSQISALGLVPEDGAETAEIAQRRAELTDQLTRMRAPVQRAEEAYSRADGLIGEIDATIRARQADALLSLGSSPVNPQLWGAALEQLFRAGSNLSNELRDSWNSPNQRVELKQNLPFIIMMVLLAVVLVARGRTWILLTVEKMRNVTRRGTGVWRFLLSLGQIFLPYFGILALTEAASATGLIGLRGTLLLEQVPQWAFILIFIRWLGDQSFRRNDAAVTIVLEPVRRKEALFYSGVLGILLIARYVLIALSEYEAFSEDTFTVLEFPIILLAALLLFRLGQILKNGEAPEAGSKPADGQEFRARLIQLLGRATMVVAVIAPVMAAIGYSAFGSAVLFPTMLTIALFGTILVLLRFLGDLYQLATGKQVSDGESLIPVLADFALVLASFPVLALIWGARVADLTELWARIREGFTIGETRISPTDFLMFLLIFAIGYTLTRLLQRGLRSSVLPKTKLDVGGQNAIVSGMGYIGIFVAGLVAITSTGLDLSSLAIVAGALSVGIGFGLQNIVSNFVSGIILLIERPISEGDWIEVGGQQGYVRDISVRSTRIETFDRTDVIVPNADLVSGTVTNFTRGNSIGRVIVPVGVAYGTDTRKVENVLRIVARDHPMVLMNPGPSVVFQGFGADSMDFEIRAILRDVNYVLSVKSDMNHEIAKRFQEEGIEIPFAQRDIWLRNPEALRPDGMANEETPPQGEPDGDAKEIS